MKLWEPSVGLDDQLRMASLGCSVNIDADALCITFAEKLRCLSSSVYNGGVTSAKHYMNLRVGPECPLTDGPASIIRGAQQERGLTDTCVGMMTAASMKSARICTTAFENESLAVVLTSGIANARCAGDHAEHRSLRDAEGAESDIGTINILVVTSFALTASALVEAVMIVSEAKCACLKNLNILSKTSSHVATGTGTDAIAIACPHRELTDDHQVRFVGKHTITGEKMARAVMLALESSIGFLGKVS